MVNKKWYALLICGSLFCSTAHAVSDKRATEMIWGTGQVVVGWSILPVTPASIYASVLCLGGAAAALSAGDQGIPLAVGFTLVAGVAVGCAWLPIALIIRGLKNIRGKNLDGSECSGCCCRTHRKKGALPQGEFESCESIR